MVRRKVRVRKVFKPAVVDAFCVKCRNRQSVTNPTFVKSTNNRMRQKGQCKECGTNTSVFVKSSKVKSK